MNQEEWVAYFELVNGRKPTPLEYQQALQKGEFAVAKSSNIHWWLIVSALLGILVLTLGYFLWLVPSATKSRAISSHSVSASSTSVSEVGASSSSSEGSTSSTSSAEQLTRWNAHKSQELEVFMRTWEQKMGQIGYRGGLVKEQRVINNFYLYDDQNNTEKLDIEYSPTGIGNAQYQIVATYANWDKYPMVHSYYFAISDTGHAVVFHSPTTNGDKMYMKESENKELTEAFTNIVNE